MPTKPGKALLKNRQGRVLSADAIEATIKQAAICRLFRRTRVRRSVRHLTAGTRLEITRTVRKKSKTLSRVCQIFRCVDFSNLSSHFCADLCGVPKMNAVINACVRNLLDKVIDLHPGSLGIVRCRARCRQDRDRTIADL